MYEYKLQENCKSLREMIPADGENKGNFIKKLINDKINV